MTTQSKSIIIHSTPAKVFAQMDNFSKTVSISYLLPKEWYYKILSFFFANWYCDWCLNNMLNDTKKVLSK